MATEIVYQKWCDVCLRADDQRIEVSYSADVAIDGKAAQHLDLCQEHAEPMVTAAALLETYGVTGGERKLIAPAAETGEHVCLICSKNFAHRSSLTAHYRSVHDTTAHKAEGTVPKRPPKPTPCPDCNEVLQSPQGLGAHRRAKHAVVGSADSTLAYHRRNEDQSSQST